MVKKPLIHALILGFALISSNVGLAAAAGVEFINFYALILHSFGLDEHAVHDWSAVLGGVLSLAVLLIVGFSYKRTVLASQQDLTPPSRFNLRVLVESILDFVWTLGEDVIGRKDAAKYFGLLATLFVFIFVSNLSGLIPGFPPATENIATNLAMGLIVFAFYNLQGFKEHGGSYVKQFFGPVWWLAWLILPIELISHLARPLSLSLRLYGNIFGDHLVLSVFTGLVYVILPAFLLFFGLLVATIQSFVFTLLSSIYISLAISHDH